MTAPQSKPLRSEAESSGEATPLAHPSARAPQRRLKPSRSEPEEELVAVVYEVDHTPELTKLQQLGEGAQAIPLKAEIPDDFFNKKWYNANDCYKQLDAARTEVAHDEDFVPGGDPILKEYVVVTQVERPSLGNKPDRSDSIDPNDPVIAVERKTQLSHKPSRSEVD